MGHGMMGKDAGQNQSSIGPEGAFIISAVIGAVVWVCVTQRRLVLNGLLFVPLFALIAFLQPALLGFLLVGVFVWSFNNTRVDK